MPIKSGIKCGFKCALRAYSMFKPPAYSLLQGSEMHGTSINAAPWNASSHRSFDGGRWGRLGSPGASALGSLWQARSLQNETGRGQRGAGIPACPRTFRRGRLALPLIRADSRPFAASFFVLFVSFVVLLPAARPTIHSRGFASIRGSVFSFSRTRTRTSGVPTRLIRRSSLPFRNRLVTGGNTLSQHLVSALCPFTLRPRTLSPHFVGNFGG